MCWPGPLKFFFICFSHEQNSFQSDSSRVTREGEAEDKRKKERRRKEESSTKPSEAVLAFYCGMTSMMMSTDDYTRERLSLNSCDPSLQSSSSSRQIECFSRCSRVACITSAISFDANIRVEGATAARRSPRVRDSQHYFNTVCPLASKTFPRIKLTMASILLTLACSLILLPLCHGAACFKSSGMHTNIPASVHVFVSTLRCVCTHGVL